MDAFAFSQRFAYSTAIILCAAGVSVISGWVVADSVPDRFRYVFGAILVLMGIYRFAVTRFKKMRRESDEQ